MMANVGEQEELDHNSCNRRVCMYVHVTYESKFQKFFVFVDSKVMAHPAGADSMSMSAPPSLSRVTPSMT